MIGDKFGMTARIVPYAMFTDPELGRVGITETDCCALGGARIFICGKSAGFNIGDLPRVPANLSTRPDHYFPPIESSVNDYQSDAENFG